MIDIKGFVYDKNNKHGCFMEQNGNGKTIAGRVLADVINMGGNLVTLITVRVETRSTMVVVTGFLQYYLNYYKL